MGCLDGSSWGLSCGYRQIAAGTEVSEGSTKQDTQDYFFNCKPGALAGSAQIAGCWPGIFVSPLSLPTQLAQASSEHDGLMVVSFIQMLAPSRANIPKDQRQKQFWF